MTVCQKCHAQNNDTDQVCRYCGAVLTPGVIPAQAYAPAAAMPPVAAGYSRLIDAEEVRRALKKNRRIGNIAAVVLSVLPLLGLVIYGVFSDRMEIGKAAVYGLILSAIFALFSIISAVRHRLARPFEGTVVDKRKAYSSERSNGASRTRYKVIVECEGGRRRKKEVSPQTFDYLQIGERVRYLPQFPQPFEKYDKRADAQVLCMFCGRKNPLSETTCSFCHNPLIK